tara:strand:+ start:7611 stop:9584 length:1974 start_codon:yes stop_codon:yes gene_type:complete
MADKINRLTYTVEINDKGKVKIEGLTKSFVKAETAFKKLGNQIKSTTEDGLNPLINKTGLAGATVTELGRTISDANYGIRGIANNLQQLSSLFVTLIATTGGFINGIKAIGSVLAGPLGIIILFQTFITLLEGGKISIGVFSKEIRALNDAMTDGAKAAGSEVGQLELLVNIAKDESLSRKDRQDAIEKINKDYPEYLENLKLEEINLEKTSSAIEKQMRLLVARAEVQALTNVITKESEKIFEAQANVQNKSAEQYASFIDFVKAFGSSVLSFGNSSVTASALASSAINSQNEIVEDSSEIIDLATKRIKDIMRETPGVFGQINNSTEKSIDKLAKLLEKYRQKLKESEAISKAEVLKVQRDAVLRQARFLGATIKQLQPILDYFNNEISKAVEGERLKDITANFKTQLDVIKFQLDGIKKLFKASQDSLKYLRDVFLSYSDARMEALKRERDYVLNSGELTGAAQKKAIEDIERREIKAQERKIKQERDFFTLKQTLLIAEEIMKTRSYVAEQILIAKTAVAKAEASQREIAIDAAAAAAKGKMSIGAFTAALGPLGTVAFGLTIGGLISSILAARKQAQSAISQLGGPSVGGGSIGSAGGGVEAPDFNVVGASPESQLAQSVMGQQEKPLRAFVVLKDIKTADELDRNTAKSLG